MARNLLAFGEDFEGSWFFQNGAVRVEDAALSFTGAAHGSLDADGGNEPKMFSDPNPATAQRIHAVGFRYRRDAGNANLLLDVDPGDGPAVNVATIAAAPHTIGTWYAATEYRFQPSGAAAVVVQFRVPLGSIGIWSVDRVFLKRRSVTTILRTALEADLRRVNGTGTFMTMIGTVNPRPRDVSKLVYPAAIVRAIRGEQTEHSTLENISGEHQQHFRCRLLVKDADAVEEVESLFDDVKNAVEADASSVHQADLGPNNGVIGAVVDGPVSDIRPVEGDAEYELAVDVDVTVKYFYRRGLL